MLSSNVENATKKIISFPLLAAYQLRDNDKMAGCVVLFTNYTEGTVVHDPTNADWLGHYSKNWEDVNNVHYWTLLPIGATVHITQE